MLIKEHLVLLTEKEQFRKSSSCICFRSDLGEGLLDIDFLSCKSLLFEQYDQLTLVNVEIEKNMGSLITWQKTKSIISQINIAADTNFCFAQREVTLFCEQ